MRLLVLADLHLGAPCPEWGPRGQTRRDQIRAALKDGVDLAIREPVDAVFVGGDLFDRPDPPEELTAFAITQFDRLHTGGIPSVVVPGVYDGGHHRGSVYEDSLWPESTMLVNWPEITPVQLAGENETLWLYSFCWHPGRTPQNPWSTFRRREGEGVHVGLVHAGLRSSSAPADLESPALTVTEETIAASGLDVVVLGRDHEPCTAVCGRTHAVVPGTPVGLTYGEWGERAFTLVDVSEDGVTTTVRPRNVAPVVDVDWDVSGLGSDPAGLAAALMERLGAAAMARVRLHGKIKDPIDVDRLATMMSADGPVVDLIDDTELDRRPGTEIVGHSVEAIFVERMRERIKKAAGAEDRAVLNHALRMGVLKFQQRGNRGAY